MIWYCVLESCFFYLVANCCRRASLGLPGPQEKASHCLDQIFYHRKQTHGHKGLSLLLDKHFTYDLCFDIFHWHSWLMLQRPFINLFYCKANPAVSERLHLQTTLTTELKRRTLLSLSWQDDKSIQCRLLLHFIGYAHLSSLNVCC